jgi:hypothetical protein
MGSNTVQGVGMAVFTSGQTPENVATNMNTPLGLGNGTVLQPEGNPKRQGSTISMRYFDTNLVTSGASSK